ncbi:protoporphyrinogen oxidase HemJ [Cypionkella sinensis]|uniref:Protoporphyrinogen IX oxidase n=1 Tax=Cypionkella sinensis TaxID=1756043 RepID=A0ABV7J499_9RHOB
MSDFLVAYYPWIKALHVISVIAWMAGLFYLPRLFVYHVEQVQAGSPTDEMFQVMERRLLKAIINPASIATWVFGLALAFTPGIVDWTAVWPWTKAACVVAMTLFHHWLGRRRKDFAAGQNILSGRQYRMMNEVPTLLMMIIVVSVIVKF